MANKTNTQFNKCNERIKYKYRQHLRRVSQKDEKTVLAELKHIRDFEIFIHFAGLKQRSGSLLRPPREHTQKL